MRQLAKAYTSETMVTLMWIQG